MADHFEYRGRFWKQMILISKKRGERIYDENDEQMINSFEELPVKIEFVLGKKIINLYGNRRSLCKRIISLLP